MGFAVRLALCCVLVATLGNSPHSALDDLLGRMRIASGPVWRMHLVSTARVTGADKTTTVRSDALGLALMTRECAGPICTGDYFDGRRVYSIGFNGTALARSTRTDIALRGIRTISSRIFLARHFVDNGGHIEDAGATHIDGRRFRVILVANHDAAPMQVFVDPTTARIRYVRAIGDTATLEYRKYHPVAGGITLPMLILRNGHVLQHYVRRSVTTSDFAAPHGLAITFSGPNAPIATRSHVVVPIFPCTLGGIAVRCLLDSGNTGLAISLSLAERLHAQTLGVLQVTGLGEYSTAMVHVGPLRFGNASIPAANYAVLHDIARDGYDVVLGADMFAAMRVEIDVARHRVRLNPPPSQAGISIPLRFADFIPIVGVRLGQLDTQLAVDTGDESNINLSEAFYRRHPTLFIATEQRAVVGVGGTSTEAIGRIWSVTIGGYTIPNQSIGATKLLGGVTHGHLGAGFFRHFILILNYASNRLRLIPNG